MKRDFLFAWYQTPRGKLLKELESEFLQRSITVSCQQTVLQIGGLGFETDFVDCSLYKYYTILDAKLLGCTSAQKIQAKAYRLPLKSDSVDMIIVPHLLEFDHYRFQTMREIERVLKPEGIVLVMNFNPWSFWVRYMYLWEKRFSDSWRAHFIGRNRVLDWLKLLNFEVTSASEFFLDTVKTKHGKAIPYAGSLTSTAYAIKAVKRRYNLIPLTPVKSEITGIVLANSISSPAQNNSHE
ncbi:class I SAM-dependent methyltransferase [Methylocucumis oryzae]|uniref:Methyltransferase type 11 n=1 Tax=Methylocucumis oryzae TaxID=1632867 RepID=A0A0F3IKW2_9GAMM|nr:methyltransferase domain-containing protein [Methylocucumis oryzae]KJV07356.1 methyltransferase type 11 [Methylocucumis oryzae]